MPHVFYIGLFFMWTCVKEKYVVGCYLWMMTSVSTLIALKSLGQSHFKVMSLFTINSGKFENPAAQATENK